MNIKPTDDESSAEITGQLDIGDLANRASFDKSLDEFSKTEFRSRSIQPNSIASNQSSEDDNDSSVPVTTEKSDSTINDQRLRETIDRLTLDNQQLADTVASLKQSLDHFAESSSEFDTQSDKLVVANRRIESLTQEAVQNELLAKELIASKSMVDQKTSEIVQLDEQSAKQLIDVQNLSDLLKKTQLQQADSESACLKLTLESKEKDDTISQLSKCLDTAKLSGEHSLRLETTIAEKESEVSKLTSLLLEQTNRSDCIGRELAESTERIDSLETELAIATASESQFRAMKKQNQSLTYELQTARSKIAAIDDEDPQLEIKVDPVFMARCRKRMKAEYKKRKTAQRQLSEAEEQRNSVSRALQNVRLELQSLKR